MPYSLFSRKTYSRLSNRTIIIKLFIKRKILSAETILSVYRETDRQTDRDTDTDTQTHRQAGRQTDRQTDTDTERDRQRENWTELRNREALNYVAHLGSVGRSKIYTKI